MANQISTQRNTTGNASASLDDRPYRIALRVFERYTAIFGDGWTRRFKTPEAHELAAREWADSLALLSDEAIKRTLEHIKNDGGFQSAPNLSQFMAMAKQIRHASHETYKALPASVMTKAEAQAGIAQLRAALAKRNESAAEA